METVIICEPLQPFGPTYPALNTCGRYRAKARAAGSIARMDRDDVAAYGEAVLAGIRRLQRSEAWKGLDYSPETIHCASGSRATSGEKILADIRRSQAAAVARARRMRTDREIEAAYAKAMAAKREALARAAIARQVAATPAPAAPKGRSAALKAWETRRQASPVRAAKPTRQPTAKGRAAALKAWETIRARRSAAALGQ